MKKILAILNLLASLPIIVGAFDHAHLMFSFEQSEVYDQLGVIGGADGPTAIFISYKPGLISILIMGLYAGLFLINGIVFWKSQSTSTEPRGHGPLI